MTQDPNSNGTGMTVLLIDDSRVMRKAITRVLADEFRILEAEDGEQGWEILNADDTIQLVISDIEMPRLDGYGLLHRIRNASTDLRTMPVIVITGAEDEATRREALSRGATDFITKPVDGVQLIARARAQAQSRITARTLVATEQTLREESTLDPLTQLSSRRYFLQRGVQDIAYARRRGQDLILLRINIDKFKQIYRQYGDAGIDHILVWLAEILENEARTEDTVARVGGADFAILAPSGGPDTSRTLAKRLLDVVNADQYEETGKTPLSVTVSIGCARLSEDATLEIDQLMDLAEQRVKQARLGGGNMIVAAGGIAAPAEITVTAMEPMDEEFMLESVEDVATASLETEIELDDVTAEPVELALGDLTPEEPEFPPTGLIPEGEELTLGDLTPEEPEFPPADLTPEGEELTLGELTPHEPETDLVLTEASVEGLSLEGPVPDDPTTNDQGELDIERAIELLRTGDTKPIEPHLVRLLASIVPLLEYGNEKLNLGVGVATELLRRRLLRKGTNERS